MVSNGQPEQVAVFFDFENLAIGARRDMPSLGQEAVSAPALKLLCQQRGSATIRRAYADWGQPQFAPYQEALALNGIDLIQVKRFGVQQKNAADIRMAVDAMEALITHPEISTYILVAGDGDYSPLVQRLREYGKTVIGVGTEASASPRLVAVCSETSTGGRWSRRRTLPYANQCKPSSTSPLPSTCCSGHSMPWQTPLWTAGLPPAR